MSKASLATQRQLLSVLSEGEFHSGQVLADTLGLSRTAIANHIKQLQQLGLDIYKVKGRGYCLAEAITLLDAGKISQLRNVGCPDILVQHITDSTNSQLMQKVQGNVVTQLGYTLVAEAQTAGRGRRSGRPGPAASCPRRSTCGAWRRYAARRTSAWPPLPTPDAARSG